jgi:hypothetical protein
LLATTATVELCSLSANQLIGLAATRVAI